MPRIIVQVDNAGHSVRTLDERISHEAHLESDHSVNQLLERISWAVQDAEREEAAART